mmetsp:Transcript_38563/g.82275  ORF Transcript_38563/g.82275 Transcript_38563/m.82275 type:complete len:355 (-) Transcript_38563:197-1261(-)
MPRGYRSVSKSRSSRFGGGNTSAWNTSGMTASLRNACAQYGLTEEQVATADPPIPCQRRSCHGNSYAVVKLSDMAALKSRLAKRAAEENKRALIEELGEEGYERKVAEEKAEREAVEEAARAKGERDAAARGLASALEKAMDASGDGIADALEGKTIGKTAAKTEWNVKPHELECLAPVDPSKKILKYRLADVIRAADRKGDIRARVGGSASRQKLYARYLHDEFDARREGVGDESIVRAAYDEIRGKIANAVEVKAAAAERAKAELAKEERRLAAFDELSSDGKKRSAATAAATEAAAAEAGAPEGAEDENVENGSRRPSAVKKRKVAPSSAAAAGSRRSGSRRRNAEVSYAE